MINCPRIKSERDDALHSYHRRRTPAQLGGTVRGLRFAITDWWKPISRAPRITRLLLENVLEDKITNNASENAGNQTHGERD